MEHKYEQEHPRILQDKVWRGLGVTALVASVGLEVVGLWRHDVKDIILGISGAITGFGMATRQPQPAIKTQRPYL